MHQFPAIATGHALLTFSLGVIWALSGQRVERVIYVAAYITGAEVLWRMTEANVYWEFGKYSVVAILLLSILRQRWSGPSPGPLAYFIFLLPSSLLTWFGLPLGEAREQVSFNLSGPLALMIGAWFFSQASLRREQFHSLLLSLMAPVVGIGAIALSSTITLPRPFFGLSSNILTSGGFGPNQVSAALGLGALGAFLFILLDTKASRGAKALLFMLMIILLTQSALTFSRGGVYLALASGLVATFFLAQDRAHRRTILVLGLLLVALLNYFLLPLLDNLTQGQFLLRFTDLDPTGRDQIAIADLLIWREHFWFGVGPGLSNPLHQILFRSSAAHTEYTRALSEHGIMGLLSLLIFFAIGIRAFFRSKPNRDRAIVASLLIWTLFYLTGNAMRLVAPAFLYGLALSPSFRENRQKTALNRHITARRSAFPYRKTDQTAFLVDDP